MTRGTPWAWSEGDDGLREPVGREEGRDRGRHREPTRQAQRAERPHHRGVGRRLLRSRLRVPAGNREALGYRCVGGENSPYIWIDAKTDSWDFFDTLLNRAGVVCTPGAGFGRCGEGFIRISAFNSLENVQQAMQQIAEAL